MQIVDAVGDRTFQRRRQPTEELGLGTDRRRLRVQPAPLDLLRPAETRTLAPVVLDRERAAHEVEPAARVQQHRRLWARDAVVDQQRQVVERHGLRMLLFGRHLLMLEDAEIGPPVRAVFTGLVPVVVDVAAAEIASRPGAPDDLAEGRRRLPGRAIVAMDHLGSTLPVRAELPARASLHDAAPATSAPMKRRPYRSAASPTVPEPANGSTIKSPGAVSAEMIGASSATPWAHEPSSPVGTVLRGGLPLSVSASMAVPARRSLTYQTSGFQPAETHLPTIIWVWRCTSASVHQ